MTLGSDSDEAEGCASSPSFYNVSLAILFLFFFLLVVAKGSAPECGCTIAQPLVYLFLLLLFLRGRCRNHSNGFC